ncbi:MAG TPA: TRAP transporter substrate-binding protein [Methylomirabilota bacterium]|nr:TRAP transporter substrate-binding protein [Methylomirabilota bacterium]
MKTPTKAIAPENGSAATGAPSRRAFLKRAAVAASAAAAMGPVRASGQGQVTLKVQSGIPPKDIFHEQFLSLAKKVEELSAGRVRMEVLPTGAVVGPFQIIEAVHTGALDGGGAVPAYWFSKQVAFSLFGTGPSFGLDAEGFLGWMHYGGGQQLYDELLKEMKIDVVAMFFGPMPTQPLGWFKKGEIKKPEDLKGIKYRTVGLSAELFKQLGSSVVIMGGGDIIPALDRGVIDAAEFNNPTSDKILGFQDVSKVYMVQSYHQPVEFLELLLNKKRWESFDKQTQAIFKYAVMAQSADMTWQFMDRNSSDLLELKTKHKVRVVKTPKSVLDAQLKAWDKIVKEKSEGNAFFTKVIESQRKWAERVVPLRQEIMVDNEPAYNHYFKAKKS